MTSQAKAVLVTGATGGLGPAVVAAFLQAGYQVAAVARHAPRKMHDLFIPIAADLAHEGAGEEIVHQTLAAAGRLDAVIHVAGGFAGGQPTQEQAPEVWQQMMQVNLHSAFRMFHAALPRLAQPGHIVAIGSQAGIELPANLSAYAVSKAALHALVRVIAKEQKSRGITANVIAPGTIDTAANRAAMPDADTSSWVQPSAIAELALWLCSEAGRSVTGAVIPMPGTTVK